ncbi:hypothetical protein TNCV_2467961 [Trichonephila clavipes]|nr:hypothetical protein TNCV_2467961 [Trichonephila clavipes]
MVRRAQRKTSESQKRYFTRSESLLNQRYSCLKYWLCPPKLIWKYGGTGFHSSDSGPGGILLNVRIELRFYNKWLLTRCHHFKDRTLPDVHLFQGNIGSNFIFVDKNVQTQWTYDVQQLLEDENITDMEWPAYCPDLSLVGHLFGGFGRYLMEHLAQLLRKLLFE